MPGLPLWMGEVPNYEVVGGNMQITVGEFVLAMPINIFLVGCARGRAAIVKWESRRNVEAEVIPLRADLMPKH